MTAENCILCTLWKSGIMDFAAEILIQQKTAEEAAGITCK